MVNAKKNSIKNRSLKNNRLRSTKSLEIVKKNKNNRFNKKNYNNEKSSTKNKDKSFGIKLLIYLIIFALGIFIIYKLYYASYLGVVLQWGLAIVVLLVSGIIIQKVDNLGGNYGIYLLKTTHGLNSIRKIAHADENFWKLFAAWGMILGFGVFSYLILGKSISKKMYAFGFISLIVITFFVLPYMTYAATFIDLPQLQNRVSFITSIKVPGLFTLLNDTAHESPILMILNIVTLSTGFAGYVLGAIFYNAGSILLLVVKSIEVTSVKPLSHGVPGVAPVIPGIDLPLVAGLIALALLLVFHEFSHGILAEISKIKLKSIGLLMLGIIPMGAFVEPDEKEVSKLDDLSQNKISIAGVSANFALMLIFFIPMILMLPYIMTSVYHTNVVITSTINGYPAYKVIPNDTYLYSWNGHNVSNLNQLEVYADKTKPGELVKLTTSNGNYSFVAKAYNKTSALIGIYVSQVTRPITNTLGKSIAFFFYTLFALSFMLNFLIGAVNLLPIPGFDGWRIYSTSIKNKRMINFLIIMILIALLLNVLPWFG